jgi:uncharacterized protein with HEPN domain
MSPRSAQERLTDIRAAIDAIADHRQKAREVGLPDSSAMLLDSVVRQLAVIGEAASHLPKEVLQRHPDIPWKGGQGHATLARPRVPPRRRCRRVAHRVGSGS